MSHTPAQFPYMAMSETGDIRTYKSTYAQLSITQIVVAGKGPFPLSPWPWPGHLRIRGQPAALLTERSNGLVDSRAITWAAHGYRFIVTVGASAGNQLQLSTAELAAIANGIALTPNQYR